MRMLVSVIIPAYNAERFVGQAIESVLAQSYRPIEVIVVNDGSTDETRIRLDAFGNQVRAIHQTNAGLSAARNRGIRESSGDLIAFLDADDLWHPQKLEKQVAIFTGAPKIGLVHTDANYLFDETGNVSPAPAAREAYQGDCFKQLFLGNRMSVSSVVVRRSLLERCGLFDEAIRRPTTQDWDLWLRLSRETRFGYVAEELVTCRMHDSNAGKNQLAMLEDSLYVIKKTRRSVVDIDAQLGFLKVRRRIAYQYQSLAKFYLRTSQFSKARRALQKSLLNEPSNTYSWRLLFKSFLPRHFWAQAISP
jgi:glycosyltransferase involved in cell wall biosynthesis